MGSDAAHRSIEFSSDLVPPRERMAYLREAFGRSIVRLELAPIERRDMSCSITMQTIDKVRVIQAQTNGLFCRRTQPLLTDGNDDFLFNTNLAGYSLPSQAGRDSRLDAGGAVLLSNSDSGAQDFPGPARFLTLRIPRRRLMDMAVKPEDALARPIPASTEALRLLVDYVQAVMRPGQLPMAPALRQLVADHMQDLVALAVGATRDAGETARNRGLRAARLNAVKDDIEARLENSDLNVVEIARRRGLTPRYIQLLFESEGTTFTEYVLAQRLLHARRLLTDPAWRDRTIADIAFEVGFGNLSYFNRVFRRRFEGTPSDLRRKNIEEIDH